MRPMDTHYSDLWTAATAISGGYLLSKLCPGRVNRLDCNAMGTGARQLFVSIDWRRWVCVDYLLCLVFSPLSVVMDGSIVVHNSLFSALLALIRHSITNHCR